MMIMKYRKVQILRLALGMALGLPLAGSLTGCSGDAKSAAAAANLEQARLEQETETMVQQAAEVRQKIESLNAAFANPSAAKVLAAKQADDIAAANAYLQASMKIISAKAQETSVLANRYRKQYLAP